MPKKGYRMTLEHRIKLGKSHLGKKATHGQSSTRLYSLWMRMRYRCYCVTSPAYPDYGRRGIIIEWQSFQEFYKDMNDSYVAHVKEFGEWDTTIDRLNSNNNYSRENCRWATRHEQATENHRPRTFRFSKQDILNIREDLKNMRVKEVAIKYKVGYTSISNIKHGQTYI